MATTVLMVHIDSVRRANIYQTFAKQLVERGLAYPCFCTEEELTEMREKQQEMKINFGYYGEWQNAAI